MSGKASQASINVTPMIDVLLVLLIIFMALAPVRPKGLEAVIAQSTDEERAEPPENPVVLSIASDGTLTLNSERVNARQLTGRLKEIFASRGYRLLFVKVAGDLEFQTVAAAIDQARDASITSVALMPRG